MDIFVDFVEDWKIPVGGPSCLNIEVSPRLCILSIWLGQLVKVFVDSFLLCPLSSYENNVSSSKKRIHSVLMINRNHFSFVQQSLKLCGTRKLIIAVYNCLFLSVYIFIHVFLLFSTKKTQVYLRGMKYCTGKMDPKKQSPFYQNYYIHVRIIGRWRTIFVGFRSDCEEHLDFFCTIPLKWVLLIVKLICFTYY